MNSNILGNINLFLAILAFLPIFGVVSFRALWFGMSSASMQFLMLVVYHKYHKNSGFFQGLIVLQAIVVCFGWHFYLSPGINFSTLIGSIKTIEHIIVHDICPIIVIWQYFLEPKKWSFFPFYLIYPIVYYLTLRVFGFMWGHELYWFLTDIGVMKILAGIYCIFWTLNYIHFKWLRGKEYIE